MSLELIEKIAQERFETEAEREAFVEAFVKEASINPQIIEGAYKALGGLGVGILGAALAKGVHSVGSAVGNSSLHAKFEQALSQVMVSNRIVKAADPTRVRGYAETIFKFAPHVAGDANVLSSILANVIHGDGVDPQTIKMLTDLEGRYKDNSTPGNFPRF